MKSDIAVQPVAKVTQRSRPSNATAQGVRPRVGGKFLFVGDEKLYVRGVTYGTFETDDQGKERLDPDVVERDFEQMAANGVNTVRTYTTPPRWLLDTAQRHGLYVLVGLHWNQHIGFLDVEGCAEDICQGIRTAVRSCAGHPAVLAYTIGNEIQTPIVRWYGQRRLARFLKELYDAVKAEDPQGLVTYVNYPSTEYLELPFLDFVCFNVYLESQHSLEAYLARLQNIAGDRPLVLAEVGLDTRRNGEDAQARVLDWQIRTAFASGCAGIFVFAWTDEWHVLEWIEDWDFGLTDRQRRPKPALSAVREAYGDVPFSRGLAWPRVSVVVCSYNGARTIDECLHGLMQLEYPNYEVIVVDDGSKDATAEIASRHNVQVITTPNRGLSNARNTGMEAATGEIIAYLDDDAYPDPHWLMYLAASFLHTDHAGIGGPNISPRGDGWIAECVANAPGNPVHVLLSDSIAEHIPGCNMAFRKTCLQEIGGFDPQFRVAGDDVDICWRLQERGWTLGYSPAAMVWHHRRNSLKAYWKQQRGYGKAEALLERKWPEKYNGAGSMRWEGRLYGRGLTQALALSRGRIYQGTWGNALFQSLYQPAPAGLTAMLLMPEWYLVIALLGGVAGLGVAWAPLLWIGLPLLSLAFGALVVQAGVSANRASFTDDSPSPTGQLRLRSVTALLHLLQPLARLLGHLRSGLTPWRQRAKLTLRLPRPWAATIWSERWQAPDERLREIEEAIKAEEIVVQRSGDFRSESGDRWDLEVRAGFFGAARTLMLVEEHHQGCQYVRFRSWPRLSSKTTVLTLLITIVATLAALDGAWIVTVLLGAIALLLVLRTLQESATAMGAVIRGVTHARGTWE